MTDRDRADENGEVARIKAAYERRQRNVDANRYSLERPGNRLAVAERQAALLAGLVRRGFDGLTGLDILEVGCGVGGELAQLLSIGAAAARLHGIDIRPDAVEKARSRIPGATIVIGDAQQLPYPDADFDLVYQATAFSSMPSVEMRRKAAAEMWRVTRPGGVIVSYDFAWNPTNRDTVGIGAGELRRLFPGHTVEVHRVTVAPPLGRCLGDRSISLARLVGTALPVLKTHRLAFVDKPR
jgi:SAM-dependent methyltransferase